MNGLRLWPNMEIKSLINFESMEFEMPHRTGSLTPFSPHLSASNAIWNENTKEHNQKAIMKPISKYLNCEWIGKHFSYPKAELNLMFNEIAYAHASKYSEFGTCSSIIFVLIKYKFVIQIAVSIDVPFS